MLRKGLIVILFLPLSLYSQEKQGNKIMMDLHDVIRLASDSSLNSFVAQYIYEAKYWEFRNYKARKLPFLNLSAAPLNFNRYNTQQYNFQDSSYYYVRNQFLSSNVNLSLSQNVTATGGRIYIDSDLMRLENMQRNSSVQYSSTPIRIGISQNLWGFNPYKWENKIEPIRFEKAKREFLTSLEGIALTAVNYFFDLARAQVNLEIAEGRLANADTLYNIGLNRSAIGTISQEDLYTLQLDKINSRNDVRDALIKLRRAQLNLYSLLRLPGDTEITLIYPKELPPIEVQASIALEKALTHNPTLLDHRQRLLESEQQVEQARKESRINASIDASFGLSQIGYSLADAYRNPLDQEMARFTINIPIVDWGLAKGKYNLAQKNLQVLGTSLQQARIDFEHDIIMTVEEFNLQQHMVAGAAEAEMVSGQAFEIARRRFINGNIQLTQLNAVQQNTIAARRAYINTLEIYWRYYYTVRQLTLFDFFSNISLWEDFELKYEQ